jgi:hypothetical protein
LNPGLDHTTAASAQAVQKSKLHEALSGWFITTVTIKASQKSKLPVLALVVPLDSN